MLRTLRGFRALPRRSSAPWGSALRVLGMVTALFASACGSNPEERLLDRWQEVSWSYEKIDVDARARVERIDGIRFQPDADRRVVRHEAEYWEFSPDRTVEIALRDGRRVEGRWRLKGRGHVLTIRYGDGAMEVYDVKELDDDRLVLNSDLGMELRGIARLEFRRLPSGADEVPL